MDDEMRRRLKRIVSGEFTPASGAEIAALEHQVGPLPSDYKDFLISYGSAIPDEELYLTDRSGRSVDLLGFYGLSEQAELRVVEGEPSLADGLVPIAESGLGDMFYVDVHSGRVYRTDDEGDRVLTSGTTVMLAADSVGDMLARLSDAEAPADDLEDDE